MTTPRFSSPTARLARLGFDDPERAGALLRDLPLDGDDAETARQDLIEVLGRVPDPDLALAGVVRLLEAAPPRPARPATARVPSRGSSPSRVAARPPAARRPPDPAGPEADDVAAVLRTRGPLRHALVAVLGSSTALSDHLVRHPEHVAVLAESVRTPDPARDPFSAESVRAELLAAVGADPAAAEPVSGLTHEESLDALRVAYRRRLVAIAGADLVADDPCAAMPEVGRRLADLAAAALETGLAIARAELPEGAPPCRIAVMGMGKCGGRELNYVSDVDVIYVVEPPEAAEGETPDERGALDTGAKLAAGLARACSAMTVEGTLWPVDANLRPEGRQGPLVRTVASHLSYYGRWAATWEFQALLKARPVAGDLDLGRTYLEAVTPLVWLAAERDKFVEDTQAMRRRVEQHVPAREGERQIKLGPGGLRDVEFSVQLLQLVHGRVDHRLRTGNTLFGLESLSTFGYVGRDDAAELDRAYRFLRTLEHRIQMFQLKRTHVFPQDPASLRRLGRSFGLRAHPQDELTAMWRARSREVRRLHEKLFYRPLLAAAANLTADEAGLSPESARARLAALGYRDPAAALRHIASLTEGVSRRALIQRQLLPVMLEWFADGADPDAGLLAFRRVSDRLGSTHWYLKMLRDSGAAAERLSGVLSSSQLISGLLESSPEAVALVEDDAALTPRSAGQMREAVQRGANRHVGDAGAEVVAALAVRRREIVRTGIADIVGLVDLPTVGRSLSDATNAAIDGALAASSRQWEREHQRPLPTRLLVVAMGRLGGSELSYGSDADVLFVHDPVEGAEPREAQDAAMAVVSTLRKLLASPGQEPPVQVDAALRPEGRNGPLVRSLESYARYYARWSSPWEAQALTRAVPAAGDPGLAGRFMALIDPLRWPEGGIDDAVLREIRRIKARVESERLPRGADPHRHLKLGRGGLADVEWTVQLLQLQQAAAFPVLRTPSTLEGLRAAADAGVLDPEDADVLGTAWRTAARVRNAVALWRGRQLDTLPTSTRDADGVARLVGYPPGSAGTMDDDYMRITRHARAVVERIFYGYEEPAGET